MIDDELNRLEKASLRDYAGDVRVERVWQRVNRSLHQPRPRVRLELLWAPAFGVALFALGVWVGRSGTPHAESAPQLVAERTTAREPIQPATTSAAPAGAEELVATPPASAERPRTPARAASTHELARMPERATALRDLPAPHAVAASGPPDWQTSADVGDFEAARAALLRAGGWDVVLISASAEQLMTLVDLARASRERDLAVRALRRLLDVFPSAPEAPLAAWTLGNLLEQGGDAEGSAEAYALYRRLSPAGDFAEDAAARQVDAALSQKDAESAALLLDQYAKDFPNGRRLAELREELAKLSHEPSAEAAPSAAAPVEPAPAPPQ